MPEILANQVPQHPVKLLIYWHDAMLRYGRYLFEAFDQLEDVSEIRVIGPASRGTTSEIYQVTSDASYVFQKTEFVAVRNTKIRELILPLSEWQKQVDAFRPDYILVLDEALAMNPLFAGIASRRAGCGPVFFYGFENIVQGIGWKAFCARPGLGTLKAVARKLLRFVVFDRMLMGLRRRVVAGGLVSYPECADIVRHMHWNPPMEELWWGINEKAFSPQGERAARVLKTPHLIGFIGRFVAEKGIFDLLEAFRHLDDSYGLMLVGDGPERAEIVRRIAAFGLTDRVALIPPQPQAELAKYYRAMDVLILPSRTTEPWKEQFGRVLAEAMMCGTPVIGSDSGAIPHVIASPDHVFPEGDAAKIAEVITRVCQETPQPEKLVARADRAASGKFAAGCMAFMRRCGAGEKCPAESKE